MNRQSWMSGQYREMCSGFQRRSHLRNPLGSADVSPDLCSYTRPFPKDAPSRSSQHPTKPRPRSPPQTSFRRAYMDSSSYWNAEPLVCSIGLLLLVTAAWSQTGD